MILHVVKPGRFSTRENVVKVYEILGDGGKPHGFRLKGRMKKSRCIEVK